MSQRPIALTVLSSLLLLSACGQDAEAPSLPETSEASTSQATVEASKDGPELGDWGISLEDMDLSVDPGDDFYRYVNGKWLDNFVIPEEFSNYGSFTVLFERSEAQVKAIIEDAAASNAAPGSTEQKIGDFFASFVDTDQIDTLGLSPIQPQLDAYQAMESHADVASAMATMEYSTLRPFGYSVGVDNKNPEQYISYVRQSGLGMPNRDFYLKEEFQDKKEAYKDYLASMLAFTSDEDLVNRANAVYALEAALAEIHWSPAKRRNADLTYNLLTLLELEAYAPELPWRTMFDKMGVGSAEKFVVRENDAIQATATIFAKTPVAVWRDYMTIHALRRNASVLPTDIDAATFAFYGQTLSGTPTQRARWKRGVAAVNGALGEAVGQIYVERHFPEESKLMMEDLVENLKLAFGQRLDQIDWMGEETKAEARDKLANFTTKIGYPDTWTDYSELEIKPGDAFGNLQRASAFDYKEMIGQLGQPIDTSEWFMTPQTVNAYYSRNRNEIVFPAAILQAPFFDPKADPAVNYGAIGAVIGHEIGHGFDDQGRKADGRGMQRDWWTKNDAKSFDALAQKLGRQYAQYSPLGGLFVNPQLTMGENIGDLGGVTMAHEAYYLALDGQEPPILDGFTGEQRFFMAWAQIWKRKYRDAELKRRLVTDSHSPSEYRTNGIVRNMDDWYDSFDISPEDALYLPSEDRVSIW